MHHRGMILSAVLFTLPVTLAHGQLAVVGVSPAPRSLTAPVGAAIVVDFDRPVLPESVVPLRSFWAFGRWSGTVSGMLSFSNNNQTIILQPNRPFSAGENIMVVLSREIEALDGSFLRDAGYAFQFWTAAQPADMDFQQIAILSTNAGAESSRPYGGIASDVDGDGWLDLTIVNEDTADLRVFLNHADATGQFADFLQPTSGAQDRASPSEPSDFNRDGVVDICVANINTDTVSVLLGNGDGTFAPQQLIPVGDAPRGIAVLDVDGDGDTDIVNTNANSSNMTLLLNDGTGTFGAATFFEGGGAGEWALAVADMTNDGILDLVIGARTSQQILIHRGNGDGTFTHIGTQSAGGNVWMLVIGDVNGDGHEDVATANSSPANNGAILLGDGAGQLAIPVTHPTDSFPLATDLGDLDGDGDLDWLTSSFGGDWRLFLNNGSGLFTLDREFAAPQAASCALPLDIDNDGDLDLALIDELADVVLVLRNGGPATTPVPALSAWGAVAMTLTLISIATILFQRERTR